MDRRRQDNQTAATLDVDARFGDNSEFRSQLGNGQLPWRLAVEQVPTAVEAPREGCERVRQ